MAMLEVKIFPLTTVLSKLLKMLALRLMKVKL